MWSCYMFLVYYFLSYIVDRVLNTPSVSKITKKNRLYRSNEETLDNFPYMFILNLYTVQDYIDHINFAFIFILHNVKC